jgi:hypothetical protein
MGKKRKISAFYGLESHYRHSDKKGFEWELNPGCPPQAITLPAEPPYICSSKVLLLGLQLKSDESHKQNHVLRRNREVLTPNILARKSEVGPVPYCKTRAKYDGNTRQGLFVNEHDKV